MTMGEVVFVVDREIDGGFSAHAVGESVFVQAQSQDELRAKIVDAMACHFDGGDLAMHGVRAGGRQYRLVNQRGGE
jgi:hypothetical protein